MRNLVATVIILSGCGEPSCEHAIDRFLELRCESFMFLEEDGLYRYIPGDTASSCAVNQAAYQQRGTECATAFERWLHCRATINTCWDLVTCETDFYDEVVGNGCYVDIDLEFEF